MKNNNIIAIVGLSAVLGWLPHPVNAEDRKQAVLEEKILQLEKQITELRDETRQRAEVSGKQADRVWDVQNKRIEEARDDLSARLDIFRYFITILVAALAFIGYKTISRWIRQNIQVRVGELVTEEFVGKRIAEKGDELIRQNVAQFETQAREKLAEIDRELEARQKMPHTLTPQPSAEERKAVNIVEKAAEKKPENQRDYGDWFAIGIRAFYAQRYDEAYHAFEQANRINETADSLGVLGMVAEKLGKHDQAEKFFQHALEADSKNVIILGNYAWFLENIRKNHDEAERLFLRALEFDPNNSNILGALALFMENTRQNPDEAEKFYLRALESDSKNVNTLGNYALFLQVVRKNYSEAEKIYQRALLADPGNAVNLGKFAGFLLALGRKDEGKKMLDDCFAAKLDNKNKDFLARHWYYRYAHFSEWQEQALRELKKLIQSGIRLPNRSFGQNIDRATADGHPQSELLKALAAVITEGADTAILERFDVWRKA